MSSMQPIACQFNDFNFNPLSMQFIMQSLDDIGYKEPTPIQAQTIPLLLEGKDIIGQAQTGTGKTAAFGLPILSQVDLTAKLPQVLILAPTRELAIQVSESIALLAKHMKGLSISTIYGGQSYSIQMRQLRSNPAIVVGTPGRVIDHIERGSLDLSMIKHLVLDEADEMLKMGFIADVEHIIDQTPKDRQTILFSATMPAPIQKIAQKHLRNPERITVKTKTATAATIEQCYVTLREATKVDALIRILETEITDGIIIFTRTKSTTLVVSDQLRALGFSSSALNGEMEQKQREATVDALKKGTLDIIVATDVAARGLDVNRISHVINFDMPHNVDAYIHRIGRTGRAGRLGKAILFCSKADHYKLKTIERFTKQFIAPMDIPSLEAVRKSQFLKIKSKISETILKVKDTDNQFSTLITEYCHENDVSEHIVASTLAKIMFGNKIDSLKDMSPPKSKRYERADDMDYKNGAKTPYRKENKRGDSASACTYRIEVGRTHGVTPRNIVGAIANEISLNSSQIGDIRIFDDFSTVELPNQLPVKALQTLENVWVAGQKLQIKKTASAPSEPRAKKGKTRTYKPKKAKEY